MSLLVFAGSAQLAMRARPLLADRQGAPLWVIWATAACVNLRFVILSAQWRPYFGVLPRGQRCAWPTSRPT
jgi:predicted branched-subunit amino acid permease